MCENPILRMGEIITKEKYYDVLMPHARAMEAIDIALEILLLCTESDS